MQYCTKCGKEFADEVVSCPYCDSQVVSKRGVNKKKIIISIIAVIIAMAVIIGIAFGITTAKKKACTEKLVRCSEEYMESRWYGDLNYITENGLIDLVDCLNQGGYTIFTTKGYLDLQEATFGLSFASYDDFYKAYESATAANNPGLAVEVSADNVVKMDDKQFSDLISEITEKFDGVVDVETIESAYTVEVQSVISMDAGSFERTNEVIVVEIDGEFKVYSPHILEVLGGFTY